MIKRKQEKGDGSISFMTLINKILSLVKEIEPSPFFVLLFVMSFSLYLEADTILSPDNIDPNESYPLIYIIEKSFHLKSLQDYVNDNDIFIYQSDKSFPDRASFEKSIYKKNINKNAISLITKGIKGMEYVLYNPLLFATSVIFFNPDELELLYENIKLNKIIYKNIINENIFLILPSDSSKKIIEKIENLIDDKDYSIKIVHETRLNKILNLCNEELDDEYSTIHFITDDLKFNQCRWLKIFGIENQPYVIQVKLDDNTLYINSDSVTSFGIDFSYPLFEDYDEIFTIKMNNNTIFYEQLPASKKIYVFDKVVIFKDELSQKDIINIIKKIKNKETLSTNKKTDDSEIEPEIITEKQEPVKLETKKTPVLMPNIQSSTEPDKFIPGKEIVKLKFNNINQKDIDKWEVNINLPDGKLFKQIKGEKNFNNEILWNGKDNKGNLLPNGIDCDYYLKFSDTNGILIESKKFKLTTALQVKKEKKKLSLEMQDILFKINSARLSPDAKTILDKVATLIKQYKPEIKTIFIEGHTDDTGHVKFNQRLSEKRAKSVLKFLVKEKLILRKNIKSKGYGEKRPVYPNTTNENRQKNRRVKIIINLK